MRLIPGEVLCINRHLPLSMPRNGKSDFTLRAPGPVDTIRILRGPTAPRPALAQGLLTWRLISHLGLDYLGLVDADENAGAQTLRELLRLYADGAGPGLLAQIDGVRHVRVAPAYRRLPHAGPAMVGRGVCVSIALDELAFVGNSTYLFETVLEQFLASHVSINSFTELDVSTLQRGKIRWPSRIGRRPIL
ncbi:Protein ImpG/VasA [Candidatus Burkholderia humilis]|nr:Protein ImpG/VasA [Candidatus Burkholderia humilis]